ncbi:MAG: AraC family transcriptional regulator [Clostridia bacterium]|nr:AraC family transcriptional regulator [Clostridia bacterium]
MVMKDGICLELCDHKTTSAHHHCFFEFVYVLKGTTLHTLGNRKMMIKEGDYFLIDIDNTHSYESVSENEEFTIINCMFLPQFLDRALVHAHQFNDLINNYLIHFNSRNFESIPTMNIYHDADKKILFLMQQMLHEYQKKDKEYMEVIRSYLSVAIINLVRNVSNIGDDGRDITHYIKEYVANNYAQPITLSEISKNVNFSLSNLSIIFTKNAGMTFREYLQNTRIKKASELLERTNKTIAEIAGLVGYTDPAFFYRLFKKTTNVTPQEYRAGHADIRN